jgi:hypothetical protein
VTILHAPLLVGDRTLTEEVKAVEVMEGTGTISGGAIRRLQSSREIVRTYEGIYSSVVPKRTTPVYLTMLRI